ncbi:cyclase family protein [Oryzibacter oryziterrae]|uniref:cyclase family protein n=1 Tax=Oryzibacter oryziterrae TaxID=2766474 RepID=UPI001F30CC63|nr:cyclase family protein [Oryzibacter oryziterrae]
MAALAASDAAVAATPTRKIVDISVAIENDRPSDPPGLGPKVTYRGHKESAPGMAHFFPGLKPEDLPNGEGWAIEEVQLTTHNGTHLDAPYHYHSTMDNGKRALTIDEVPLEWCYRPGVKLDFRHLPDGHVVSAAEVEAELKRIGHELQPLDIVLVNTSAAAQYGTMAYLNSGCGMGREATLWLLERGVRVTGTDAWSWDVPFSFTAKRFEQTHDKSIIWEGHFAGIQIGYCHMEKLSNLDALPSTGFEVICMPVKIKGASAGWTRAVALVG